MTPRHRPEKQANPAAPPGSYDAEGWWTAPPGRADPGMTTDRETAWKPEPPYDNPTSMQLQPPPPPKKRRHVFRWVFLAVQALFLTWTISGAVSGGGTPKTCAGMVGQALKSCQDAGHAGTAIGVGLIIVVWAAVDVVLALTWLIFRRRS